MPRSRYPGVEIREAADGSRTYRIRWRQDGRNLSHSFDRERLAVDALNRIHAAGSVCHCPVHAPGPAARAPGLLPTEAPAAELTFGEYARRHAAAMTGVGEGYRRDVLRDVSLHLREFGGRPLKGERAVDRLEVQEWIRGMETGGHWWLHDKDCDQHDTQGELPCSEECRAARSPATIRRILAEAGAVMESAMVSGKATTNPFRKHRLSRTVTDEHQGMTFLTHAEWKILEAALPEGTARDLCGFLVGSGLRWGEATAVAVGAVDLLASPARVHVGRAWKKDGKGSVVLGVPKSARSRRTVPIADWVRDLLIPHVMGKADEEFVFTARRGGPLSHHSNFYNKVWTPAVDKAQSAGLTKRPRLHDLRHTFVSWSLAEGVPLHEVSRRVGHQSVHITDARYSHLLPQADAAFAAALERYRTRPAED